jgi:hypothetical protein
MLKTIFLFVTDNLAKYASVCHCKPLQLNLRMEITQVLMQLVFNLCNEVTDTLESSSILIYLETRKSIYTQWGGEIPSLIKWLIKMVANRLQLNE